MCHNAPSSFEAREALAPQDDGRSFAERTFAMKLTYSPASPFARKVRIAAIELGLIDSIELSPVAVAPGQPNDEYSKIHPLKKLPVLILDNGDVVVDSYV